MRTLKNIQIVSSLFFYFFGFVIFGLIFLLHNHYYQDLSLEILKTLELPFALVALLYGMSSLRLSFGKEQKSDVTDAVFIFIGGFTFALLIYLNFAFEDFI